MIRISIVLIAFLSTMAYAAKPLPRLATSHGRPVTLLISVRQGDFSVANRDFTTSNQYINVYRTQNKQDAADRQDV